VIIAASCGIYFSGDNDDGVRTELLNIATPVVQQPIAVNRPSVVVNPTPTPVSLVAVQTIVPPLSDRSFPNTVKTPTPAPLNFINEDQFLWLASNTSWRPYLYTNDYKIFHKLWDIASCESGNDNGWIRIDRVGDTDIDDGPSLGLMQINIFYWPSLHEAFNLFDPIDNLQAAWEVWNIQGWEAWSCHEE
tara:strand:- start:1578 stop:2147 length:570 start_codon:yes stop_codon:yes gene_type:complete